MAKARTSGEVINPVSAVSKMTHQMLIDLKDGWSSAD